MSSSVPKCFLTYLVSFLTYLVKSYVHRFERVFRRQSFVINKRGDSQENEKFAKLTLSVD